MAMARSIRGVRAYLDGGALVVEVSGGTTRAQAVSALENSMPDLSRAELQDLMAMITWRVG